ncbi:MAG: TonB-dependent receptor [Proteobacteria bacterium]|nr:TonB-dependent receptor [Pseudomonadota bacterium]
MQTTRERLLASTMIGGAALAALVVTPAAAQDQPAQVKEVVITGSRIPQPGLTSTSPLSVINDQEVKLQGTTNAENLVNSLPQVFASYGSEVSNGSTGTATVNLRGLGTRRTLVLIDGKRMMPGDPVLPVADLNQIPATLIDRVELVTGGASAVYGSDAISGVVNFIMKKDFEGLRIDSQYAFYQHDNNDSFSRTANTAHGYTPPTGNVTDGATWDFTAVMGASSPDGKGNVTAYMGYRNTQAVTENKRDFSNCSYSAINNNPLVCQGSSTSFPGRFTSVTLAKQPSKTIADSSGNLTPYSGAANSFNFAPYNYFQRPDERYTGGYFAHYQLKPWMDVYSSFMFMDDHTVAQIAPSGAFFGRTFAVNCDNPLLSAAEVTQWCTSQGLAGSQDASLFIGRRNVEGGPRQDDLRHDAFRLVLGAKGDFADAWTYDVYAQYGATVYSENYLHDLSLRKIGRSLEVVNVAGVPTCKSVVDGTDLACVPWNIFKLGGVTPAATAYLDTPGFKEGNTTEQVVSASISGDLGKYGMKSPWAKDGLGVALGAEYRREALDFRTDLEMQTGDLAGQGGPIPSTHGTFDVKEVFGEVRAPIVQDAPFAKDLSIEGGYRTSDYSSSGHINSYKVSGEWAPTDDIRFRGSYQRAVRAPNIVEMFTPQAIGLFGGQDPCAGAVPTASLAACQNMGVTAGQYGSILQCSSAQCNGLFGGNPTLKPEESTTKSYGVVFTPSFIKGFNATVDYFDIDLTGAIGALPATSTLASCVATGNPLFCGKVHRAPVTGVIFGGPTGYVQAGNVNAGFLATKGLDLEMNYRANLSDWGMGDHGGLRFNLVGTYTQTQDNQPSPTAAVIHCAGMFGPQCGTPTPKWRHKFRTTWTTPWRMALSADWRYIGGSTATVGGPNMVNKHIEAFNYLDLSGTWNFRDGMQLRAGVNNLFDKKPPVLDSSNLGLSSPPFGNGNTFPQVYDALGRTFFIGITADF